MAKKPDIQYISQFYVPGSEAQVIEFKPKQQPRQQRNPKPVQPQAAPEKKIVLRLDMASVCGLVVAAAMLICLVVGACQYLAVCAEHRAMSDKIIMLQNEYVVLRQEYRAGYDMDEVVRMAEAIGMVHQDDLQPVSIRAEVPVPEAEPTWWENTCWFFEGLFA